jgi:hypothetical protein
MRSQAHSTAPTVALIGAQQADLRSNIKLHELAVWIVDQRRKL